MRKWEVTFCVSTYVPRVPPTPVYHSYSDILPGDVFFQLVSLQKNDSHGKLFLNIHCQGEYNQVMGNFPGFSLQTPPCIWRKSWWVLTVLVKTIDKRRLSGSSSSEQQGLGVKMQNLNTITLTAYLPKFGQRSLHLTHYMPMWQRENVVRHLSIKCILFLISQ